MNTDEHRSVFICVHLWFRFWLQFYCAVHLRVLRVSVVNKVLEFLSSLASRNPPGLVMA